MSLLHLERFLVSLYENRLLLLKIIIGSTDFFSKVYNMLSLPLDSQVLGAVFHSMVFSGCPFAKLTVIWNRKATCSGALNKARLP